MKAISLSIVVCTLSIRALAGNFSDTTLPNHKFRIGIDVLKPLNYLTKDETTERVKIEFPCSYKLNSLLYPGIDLGYGKGYQQALRSVQHYYSSGFYLKPGLDINMLPANDKYTSRFMLLIGYRYAVSFYEEKNKYIFKSNLWGTERVEEEKFRSVTEWHELLFSFRYNFRRTKKTGISLGITQRIRYKPQESDHSRLYIPGYGGNNPLNYAVNFDIAMLF